MAPARRKKTSAAAAAAMAAQWKVGDLVLAKMKGFPAWPAMISEPEKWGLGSVKKKILVYFYGTQQIAFCNYADLELFTEEKKKTILSKRHGKGSDFVRAVEEIVAIYEDLKKQNHNDVISGTNVQNNLTSELPNELIPDEAQSSNLNNNNNTINSNNTAEQQCIVNSVPDESIEKVSSILDELRQNPFSTSVTTKKRNRESQPQNPNPDPNPNPNPNSSKRTRLQKPSSFGLDKSAENEPFNAKTNGYIFEPVENETLEKEAGSSTATGEHDLPPKTVFCKRKRRPNRKRSTSNFTGLEYSKETNQETLNPKQNYNESDESGEPLPDSPNSNSNSNSRNNEVNNKSDGDEHLPLVKRARVRMERSLVEEPKLNPNNGESGFFKPNEAALPPSKRLHRALEAMSANVAETTDEKIESSAGSGKLVQNGYGLEGPKLHTSDSPKVKEESSSSKLSPLESHKMPQLVSQQVKESGGIILERPKLPPSASPEAILESHKLPLSASPKAFLESLKLPPPASPKVFLKSPKLPPSASSEVFLKSPKPPLASSEALESPKLPPSASSEAFLENPKLPPSAFLENPKFPPSAFLENPKLPPSASSEAFLENPKLPPSASSEALSENPKLPPSASSEVSLERPELHHLASQVDSPILPELASSETKPSEKPALESPKLHMLASEVKISEKPELDSPNLLTKTSEVQIYEKPALESPKLHTLVSNMKISEKTGLESPNLDSLASEVRISEKRALESPNLPKQASPEAKLSRTVLENAELEVKPDEICKKVPENITIPLEKICQSEVVTKNESHLSENIDANADINNQNVGTFIISDTGAERVTIIPETESVSSASNYDADTKRDVTIIPESAQNVSNYDADIKRDAIIPDNAQTGESHISQVTTTPINHLIPATQAKRPVSSKNLLESPFQEPSGSSTTQLQQPPCPSNPSVVRAPSTSPLNPPIVRVPSAVPNTSPLNPSIARVPSIVPNTSPLNPPVVRVPSVVPRTSPLNPPIVRVPTVAPSTSPLNPPIVRVPSAVPSTSPLNLPTVRVPSVVPSSVAHASRKAFEAFISTLTRTKDSIGRATRLAMECAKYGNAGEVMDIILETLEKESNLHKRVDFFFLVDSITQWSRNQKGGAGDVYIPLLQSVLPRILCSVAPPGVSAWDNRKHCLKVLKLWLERKTLPEYMIRQHIRELESMNDASFSTSSLRRPTRTERPLNDPVREMEGMLVDEYGSNTSFQLPPDFRSTLTEASDEEEGPASSSSSEEKIFEAVTPERDPNVSPNAADNKHRLVLAEVDGELEMEDVSPVNNASSIESDRPVNGSSMESNRVVNSRSVFAPPLPYDRPPSPPPLPASPPPPPPGASLPYKVKNQQPHQVNSNLGASQSVQFYNSGYRAPPPPPPPQPHVNNFRTPNNNNNNNSNFGPSINQPPLHNNGCNNNNNNNSNNNNNNKGYHVPPQPPPYSAYPQYPYPESPYHRDNRGFRGPSEVSYGPPRPDCGHYGPPPRPGSTYPPPSRPHVGSPSAAHGYWRPR